MPRKKKERPTNGDYYECKITIGRDITGKPIRKSFLSKISKADAKKKAEAYKVQKAAEMMVGEVVTDEQSLSRWADQWLEAYKSGREDATYSSYERPIRLYIKPYFGDTLLKDIYPISIRNFYASLPAGRSQSFYHKVYLSLNGLLESAVENNKIRRNPHRGIEPTKGKPPAVKRTYTQDERDKLLAAAQTHSDGIDIILLLTLGLRREELLALRWEDIDLIHKSVKIDKAVKITRNGGAVIGSTKNEASIRVLPIMDDLAAYLSRYQRTGYVCCAPSGGSWNPNTWAQRYYNPLMEQICNSLHLPVLNPHELRHTCGTLLYQATGDIYAVSKYLGHASIEITAKIYVHSNLESLRKAVQLSNKVQQPKTENPILTTNAVNTGF